MLGEEFASAGLGLNIPLSKIFNNWWCERMLTSSQNVEDLEGPDQCRHMMYNAGVKLTFGAKSNSPASVYKSQVDDALIR
jgi:hypothetical protein